MKTFGVYDRASTKKQANNWMRIAASDDVANYANETGFIPLFPMSPKSSRGYVLQSFLDIGTGTRSDNRPAFLELVGLNPDIIVINYFDRIARGGRVWEDMNAILYANNIKLVIWNNTDKGQGHIDFTNEIINIVRTS